MGVPPEIKFPILLTFYAILDYTSCQNMRAEYSLYFMLFNWTVGGLMVVLIFINFIDPILDCCGDALSRLLRAFRVDI